MSEPETRPSTAEMLTRAGRAVGKVDIHGARGLTMVTYREIEAMALTLAWLGIPALPPDGAIEDPASVSPAFDPKPSTPKGGSQ